MLSNETVTQEIIDLFQKHGHIDYGENCSQLSHSMQAGLIAQEKGYDDELVLAAFLHDIGHLCPLEQESATFERMGDYGVDAHDKWGEEFLRSKGFSDRIVATVRNHVAAKRYLCFADAGYYDRLSEASRQTLIYQGGPMDAAQARDFEQDPFFEDSILIRQVDEEAKLQDFVIREAHWAYFAGLLDKIDLPLA